MVSQKVLQNVLGLFAVILNFRRPCYAVLDHIYWDTDSHGPGWKRISRAIAEELHAACLLVSCAVSSLRPSPYSRLQATDATPIRAGTCTALISEALAVSLLRAVETGGSRVYLALRQAVEEEKLLAPSKHIDRIAPSSNWQVEASYSFRFGGRFNLQESRALKH